MKFAIGLLIFLAGLALDIYYKKVTDIVGYKIEWAEKYLGSTYYAYFLFGLIGIILGILMMFNFLDLGFLGL